MKQRAFNIKNIGCLLVVCGLFGLLFFFQTVLIRVNAYASYEDDTTITELEQVSNRLNFLSKGWNNFSISKQQAETELSDTCEIILDCTNNIDFNSDGDYSEELTNLFNSVVNKQLQLQKEIYSPDESVSSISTTEPAESGRLESQQENTPQKIITPPEKIKAPENSGDIITRAYSMIGVPYVFGGCSPCGVDCSGLVSYCLTGQFKRIGTTHTFMLWPEIQEPIPGCVCTTDSHCGIYIGDGKMIHAPEPGDFVRISYVQKDMIFVLPNCV